MTYNAPGQKHYPVYVKPAHSLIPLHDVRGEFTGYGIAKSMLEFTGAKTGETKYDGRLRLDYHELLRGLPGGPMCMFLGGNGYKSPMPKYGYVRTSDIVSLEGHRPRPSGEGRGSTAPAEDIWRVLVERIPSDMHYKESAGPGQVFATYGNAGDRDGNTPTPPGHQPYTYLLWSTPTVAGGGQVRGLLSHGTLIRACRVPRVQAYSWAEGGRHNGFVQFQYVRVQSGDSWLYGWTVAAHQHENGPEVAHLEER